jgi:hypothetical protein
MGTHYLARELSALGHDVRQVPALYAKPFRHGSGAGWSQLSVSERRKKNSLAAWRVKAHDSRPLLKGFAALSSNFSKVRSRPKTEAFFTAAAGGSRLQKPPYSLAKPGDIV